jgi:hypothetical protein
MSLFHGITTAVLSGREARDRVRRIGAPLAESAHFPAA